METTNNVNELQNLEVKLAELDKRKENAIKLHQESVDCYIGIIELKLWEKRGYYKYPLFKQY